MQAGEPRNASESKCVCVFVLYGKGEMRPEHTPVSPSFSAEAGRHTNREGAVGHTSLVPELADRRMGSLGGIAARTSCSE